MLWLLGSKRKELEVTILLKSGTLFPSHTVGPGRSQVLLVPGEGNEAAPADEGTIIRI